MNGFSSGVYPILFSGLQATVKKIARLGVNKSFTVVGEFIEDNLTSVDSFGNFHAYEFIEQDNTFSMHKGILNETGTESTWGDITTNDWSDVSKYIWNEVLTNEVFVYLHEMIEVETLE